MDYGTIVSQVASIVEDTSQSADTDIRNMVNNRYRNVWGYAMWPELLKKYDFASVKSQQTYAFSTIGADLGKIKNVLWLPQNITNTYEKLRPEPDIHAIMQQDKSVEGDPLHWTEFESNLYVWPVPNYAAATAFRVIGKKTVADLATDSDTPFFDARWHQILVYGGAWEFFDKDDDTRAQIYERYYNRGLLEMHQERVAEQDEDGVHTIAFSEG